MATTDAVFAAFLRCTTKAYLLGRVAIGDGNYSDLHASRFSYTRKLKLRAVEWLRSVASEGECYVGMPSLPNLETGRYPLILDPLMESSQVCSQPEALLRIAASGAPGAHYCPVRFIVRDKALPDDRLLLAFDAIAISRVTGRLPHTGKLICGARLTTLTIPLVKLLERV
jgi:hypothetical protein